MTASPQEPMKGRTGLDRIVHAAINSWSGLRLAYSGESAFRQETWLAVMLLPAAFWVGRDLLEVALLAGSVVLVLIVELLNSAVEALADALSVEHHPLLGRAKDLGSAAVMLALLGVPFTWALVLWPR